MGGGEQSSTERWGNRGRERQWASQDLARGGRVSSSRHRLRVGTRGRTKNPPTRPALQWERRTGSECDRPGNTGTWGTRQSGQRAWESISQKTVLVVPLRVTTDKDLKGVREASPAEGTARVNAHGEIGSFWRYGLLPQGPAQVPKTLSSHSHPAGQRSQLRVPQVRGLWLLERCLPLPKVTPPRDDLLTGGLNSRQ